MSGCKKEIKLNDLTAKKGTFNYSNVPTPPNGDARSISSASDGETCQSRTSEDAQVLGGEVVVHDIVTFRYKTVTKASPEEIVETTTSYAPRIDCYPVKMEAVRKKADGTITNSFQRIPLSVSIGSPTRLCSLWSSTRR